MDKKTKLVLGVLLLGAAVIIAIKSKKPKTSASTDPVCKDGEHLEDLVSPCLPNTPCPPKVKICKPNSQGVFKVKCNDGTEDVSNGIVAPCINNGGVVGSTRVSTGGLDIATLEEAQTEGFGGY
jgi:hypothetical protein